MDCNCRGESEIIWRWRPPNLVRLERGVVCLPGGESSGHRSHVEDWREERGIERLITKSHQ